MHRRNDKPQVNVAGKGTKRRHWRGWRWIFRVLVVLVVLLIAARIALPYWVRSYVNRVIARNPLYQGQIGAVDMRLWQGGYTIHDIRLNKTTGNVPVPFFYAKSMHLVIEWRGVMAGKLVGQVVMEKPELNFVGSQDPDKAQTGGEANGPGGTLGTQQDPWLSMLRDLYPFKIDSVEVHEGQIHFRAFDTKPPVDVYLSRLEGRIDNLTNIHDELAPLITTIDATALAMDQARFEFHMKLDPFSYRPTFQLATRLIGLDVTQTNSLTKAYGQFDFERGTLDLVLEMNSKEGQLQGYVKPLFRHVSILSANDIKSDNPLQFFWEALVGLTWEVFKNQPRDQFATLVPMTGDLAGPQTNVLSAVGNILRNAFIRAFLPRFEKTVPDVDYLQFKPGSVVEPLPGEEGK